MGYPSSCSKFLYHISKPRAMTEGLPYGLLRPATLGLQRLETDLEPMPGRLGEAPERARGGQAAPAFEPRDRALRRLHAPGKLGLAEARALARLGDFEDERE